MIKCSPTSCKSGLCFAFLVLDIFVFLLIYRFSVLMSCSRQTKWSSCRALGNYLNIVSNCIICVSLILINSWFANDELTVLEIQMELMSIQPPMLMMMILSAVQQQNVFQRQTSRRIVISSIVPVFPSPIGQFSQAFVLLFDCSVHKLHNFWPILLLLHLLQFLTDFILVETCQLLHTA